MKQSPVQRGPKVVESKQNINTLLKEKEWRYLIEKESKDNISYSILYNSLRLGLDKQGLGHLRPQIWGFLINIDKMAQQYVAWRDLAGREVHRAGRVAPAVRRDRDAEEADRGGPAADVGAAALRDRARQPRLPARRPAALAAVGRPGRADGRDAKHLDGRGQRAAGSRLRAGHEPHRGSPHVSPPRLLL